MFRCGRPCCPSGGRDLGVGAVVLVVQVAAGLVGLPLWWLVAARAQVNPVTIPGYYYYGAFVSPPPTPLTPHRTAVYCGVFGSLLALSPARHTP